MDTEETRGKERRKLARDLLGHADPAGWTAEKEPARAEHSELLPALGSAVHTEHH